MGGPSPFEASVEDRHCCHGKQLFSQTVNNPSDVLQGARIESVLVPAQLLQHPPPRGDGIDWPGGGTGGASGGAPCVSGVMLHDKEGLRLSEESHGPRTPRNRMAWHWTPFPWPQPTGLTVGAQGRRGAHGSQGGDTEIPQEGLRPRPRAPRLAETSPSLLGLPVSHGLGPGSPAPDATRMSPALPPSSKGRTLRMKSWERSSVCPERSGT